MGTDLILLAPTSGGQLLKNIRHEMNIPEMKIQGGTLYLKTFKSIQNSLHRIVSSNAFHCLLTTALQTINSST